MTPQWTLPWRGLSPEPGFPGFLGPLAAVRADRFYLLCAGLLLLSPAIEYLSVSPEEGPVKQDLARVKRTARSLVDIPVILGRRTPSQVQGFLSLNLGSQSEAVQLLTPQGACGDLVRALQ